jgi:hypothetical protein
MTQPSDPFLLCREANELVETLSARSFLRARERDLPGWTRLKRLGDMAFKRYERRYYKYKNGGSSPRRS